MALTGCKNCTKRKIGCHSTCKTYADYKKEIEHINKLREEEKAERSFCYGVYRGKYNNYLRKT